MFLRARRFLSRISIRLLAFNVLLVFLPAAGVSYLAIYERKLLQAQEQAMVQQGRLLAASLSERGPLSPSMVEPILLRLEQRTPSRIRVLDREGWLLSDTVRLGPRRKAGNGSANREPDDPRARWLYRIGSSLFRFVEPLLAEPSPPVGQDYYSADRPFDGLEIMEALEGRYGAATRITPGGQRSVTLYSAIPIQNEGEVSGVVLVSQSTYQILQDLYEVRLAIFRFLLWAVAVAAILSLLLSTTISRPLTRLRTQAKALLDRRGRLTGRFKGSNRLDEIGELDRALSELSSRLEERMRFIESFSAAVSHEFKNPLTSIRAAAEMLKDVDAPEERERFAAMVEAEIARLEKLLSEVREITRFDASGVEDDDDTTRVNLVDLLRGTAATIAARQPKVRFELDVPSEAVEIAGSPDWLSRAFENLIDNASSFSPEGGRVRIALATSRDEAILRVEDEGPGIPEGHRDRIFDRFFSYRPCDERARDHSGLGLAIVKTVLERHGGSIRLVESPLGGAGFEVRLSRA